MDNFGNIRPHHWKERFKISKIAKFESDLLKAYKDTSPQSREILQMLVWRGGGHKKKWFALHHAGVYKFSQLRGAKSPLARIALKFGNFPNSKAQFSVV